MTINQFLDSIDIKPNNIKLYEEALTHNSYFNEKRAIFLEEHNKYKAYNKEFKSEFVFNYQRLEFLGDAVLQLWVSDYIFKLHPYADQGVLTKLRSNMVREESLAIAAKNIKLGSVVRLGTGELNSKGYEKFSILADIYESFTAAIFLDQSREVLEKWLEKTLIATYNTKEFQELIHDYKSELQEFIQLGGKRDLKYELVDEIYDNKLQKNLFYVQIKLDNMVFGEAKHWNKHEAERQAAKAALSKLRKK